ncbi:nitroreductase family protein [Rubinisphaera margarita]|uniref:nitroreductase family protein n=1 Tax=Rubinisphaera margarita TaxID=2909586 RepID=UPI001EE7FE87|nr:nitroreductase family protein [Rubinisphaera margarita]MCG6155127.1 nitroreductase family protein [Rubinisphaera margarita]
MRAEVLSEVIRERCTEKVLSSEPFPASAETTLTDQLLELAAWAPFHRPADATHLQGRELAAVMPWRFYVLDAASCRRLRDRLLGKDSSKIMEMLATADCLVQATWLPNPAEYQTDGLFAPTLENMEHLAAAGAAVQNLLLGATASGIRNYWSSGGILRTPEVFDLLGIPPRELLLGSLFFFPQDVRNATVATSKLRDKRGPLSGWVERVSVR